MLPISRWTLILCALAQCLASATIAQDYTYPSNWLHFDEWDESEAEADTPDDLQTTEKAPKLFQASTSTPSFALGVGVNFPDILPIELIWLASPWLSFRTFVVPITRFTIRVEYGRSVLANQNGLSIENPDLAVDFLGKYGPQYGSEIMLRPFRGSFYTSFGLSYRRLELVGDLLSDLILTSSAGSIETNSLISLKAKASAAQVVQRASIGWLWTFCGDKCYLNLTLLGLTVPHRAHSDVRMQAKILNPIATVEVRNEIIEEAERRFADDLARQAKDSMKPVEKLSLPIIGISLGISF